MRLCQSVQYGKDLEHSFTVGSQDVVRIEDVSQEYPDGIYREILVFLKEDHVNAPRYSICDVGMVVEYLPIKG